MELSDPSSVRTRRSGPLEHRHLDSSSVGLGECRRVGITILITWIQDGVLVLDWMERVSGKPVIETDERRGLQ